MAKLFARLWFLVLAVIVGAAARAADGSHAALETFSGEWEGELRVFALDGFLLKTFPAHRYYNWNGTAQVVVTRFFDGASDYETHAMQLADAGRLTSTVSRPGQAPEEFAGTLESGAIVWINTSNNKRDYSERLVTTDGVTRLETNSSEIMRVKGVSGVVRVTGSFQRSAAASPSGASPAQENPSLPNERIAALERELAAARRAAATAAQASAAIQSDLTREAADLRIRIAKLETERVGLETRAAGASSAIARFVELEQSAAAARRAAEAAQNAGIIAAGQTAALRERVAALEAQLRDSEATLATARAGAVDASGDKLVLAQRDAAITELRARLERSSFDLAAIQRQLEQARARQSAAATSVAAAEARAVAAETETKERLAELHGQLQSANAARAQAAAEAARLTGQLAQLRTDAEKARAGASAESVRIQQLERDLTAAQEAGRKHDAATRELQTELADARAARAQQEKDNAAASSALVATRAEAERLAARIKQLETTVASVEQTSQASTAAAGSIERERADLRQQIATLVSAAESSKTELGKLQAERDALATRVAVLAARPDVAADALATERRQAQERLERAENAALDATARLAAAEKQITEIRATALSADAAAAGLDELRRALAAAQADTAAARRQTELLQSERDLLAFRLKGTDEALAERQSALQSAETAVADARHRADAAEARLQQLETAGTTAVSLRAELDLQRTRATEREEANARLTTQLAELDRERAALGARLTELEQTAKADTDAPTFTLASAPTAPTVPAGQRGESQAELTRLQRRVTELESERNSIRNKQTLLQEQLDQTRQLRDDSLARFQDVVAQLNTMRDERDRLARATVSLQAELRAARGPGAAAAPAAAPAGGTGPSFLDRLLGNTETPKPAAPAATAPEENDLSPSNPVIEDKIAALQIIGVTRAAEGDKVILNGRLYHSGDVIDPGASIVFERVDGDALIFSDGRGREYRRRF